MIPTTLPKMPESNLVMSPPKEIPKIPGPRTQKEFLDLGWTQYVLHFHGYNVAHNLFSFFFDGNLQAARQFAQHTVCKQLGLKFIRCDPFVLDIHHTLKMKEIENG